MYAELRIVHALYSKETCVDCAMLHSFVYMYAELRIVHSLHDKEACVDCAMLHRCR